MKVCSYCHIAISDSESVCPRDGQSPIEVQPEAIVRDLEQRFDSIEFFGRGSTGDLYLANDSLSQQHGLLKILRSTSSNYAAERMRIKRELAKQTNFSNHIVPVIAIGESGEAQVADKALWLFRQRIDGESLNIYLKREGRIKLSTAIAIAAQMVMGLDTIHRAGLLHRDIKPGHVMLQFDESDFPHVVLLDTGIPARIETKSLFDLVGTPAYISPEQIAGKLNSPRSDLYALGCVLYEMLVGRPPFIGNDTSEIFKAHQTAPPPIPEVDIPDPLRSLILSLLAKEPRERPFSAQQVFRTLEPFLPPSPLFKRSPISSRVVAPRPVVTNQPTKTVSGIVSPASIPPPIPLKPRRSAAPPIPISAIKSSVPPPIPSPKARGGVSPRPPRITGSVPTPPKIKSSVPPPPKIKSSVPPPPIIKSSAAPPRAFRTKSSVPPPPVPQGPISIPRDVPPDDLLPITAGVSNDTAEQTDGVALKDLDLLIGETAISDADAGSAVLSKGADAISKEKFEASSPVGREASRASGMDDEPRQSPETDTARIKGRTLEKVLTVSAQDTAEAQPALAPEIPEPIGPISRSNRPSVDFQVESLFDDELPPSASGPGGTEQQFYPPSDQPVEIPQDSKLQFSADTQRTLPASVLQRYDRRLIFGVAGGLIVSVVLLFALSNWESDSEKTEESKPVPTHSSQPSKSEEQRDNAVSATPPSTEPSAAAAEEDHSNDNRPSSMAEQDDEEQAASEDDGELKRSSRSKPRKSSTRTLSRASRSDQSDSADKLRDEAREHYAAGRYKSAATAYRKITKMKPSDAGAYAGLGASYLALNRSRRAIKAYKSAIKLKPKNSGFHAALARAYASKGDRDLAIKTYQKALKLNPRNRVAKVALRQLTQ